MPKKHKRICSTIPVTKEKHINIENSIFHLDKWLRSKRIITLSAGKGDILNPASGNVNQYDLFGTRPDTRHQNYKLANSLTQISSNLF